MFDFTIHSVGRYTHRQQATQTMDWALLGFHISGLTYYQVGDFKVESLEPFLSVIPAKTPVTFQFDHTRENWAILLQYRALRLAEKPGSIELHVDGHKITLPMITSLAHEHVSGWEGEFLRIRKAFETPFPKNQLRAALGINNIFRYIIDQQPDTFHASAAQRLRWLIDEDRLVQKTLEELSCRCGYSSDRLRLLFQQEFGISPQAYRNKRRMAIAADWLCNSDLRIKEISTRIGCKHVSHFCALFKQTFNMSPKQYTAKFRHL